MQHWHKEEENLLPEADGSVVGHLGQFLPLEMVEGLLRDGEPVWASWGHLLPATGDPQLVPHQQWGQRTLAVNDLDEEEGTSSHLLLLLPGTESSLPTLNNRISNSNKLKSHLCNWNLSVSNGIKGSLKIVKIQWKIRRFSKIAVVE
jgi:hypothetical protein